MSPPTALSATPRTARLFSALAPHDQRHLVAVHEACLERGLTGDIALAGLLHDIGKASLSGRRVTLVDRSLRVLLARLAPNLLRRLHEGPRAGWQLGLLLAGDHPRLGAGRLDALGWPVAITEAVRQHEATSLSGERAELKRIDDLTP